jgi:hypothetical protein
VPRPASKPAARTDRGPDDREPTASERELGGQRASSAHEPPDARHSVRARARRRGGTTGPRGQVSDTMSIKWVIALGIGTILIALLAGLSHVGPVDATSGQRAGRCESPARRANAARGGSPEKVRRDRVRAQARDGGSEGGARAQATPGGDSQQGAQVTGPADSAWQDEGGSCGSGPERLRNRSRGAQAARRVEPPVPLGAMITARVRDGATLPSPGGDARAQAGDTLALLGTDGEAERVDVDLLHELAGAIHAGP